MIDAISAILPLILIFLFGYGLKRSRLFTTNDGSTLLKLIFYAGLPALIFLTISRVELERSMFILSMFAPVMVIITLMVCFALRKTWLRHIGVSTFGAMLTGAVIMNTGFLIPFVETIFGPEGLARLVVIDALNAVVTFAVVFPVVVHLANRNSDRTFILKKILLAPAIWALIIALVMKFFAIAPPGQLVATLELVAKLVGPTILLALGLKFTATFIKPRLLLVGLSLRFVLGALVGLAFIRIFDLQGLDAQIVALVSIAPIGFNSITFAELEGLDTEFAASQVSFGILVGIAVIPLAGFFLPRIYP